jgi:hypothetical protein
MFSQVLQISTPAPSAHFNDFSTPAELVSNDVTIKPSLTANIVFRPSPSQGSNIVFSLILLVFCKL